MDCCGKDHLHIPSKEQSSEMTNPEWGTSGQSPAEGLQASHKRRLDFAWGSTGIAAVTVSDGQDYTSPTASPVPGEFSTNAHSRPLMPFASPQQPQQANSHPVHDTMNYSRSSTGTNGQTSRTEDNRLQYHAQVPGATPVMRPNLLQSSAPDCQTDHLPLVATGLTTSEATQEHLRDSPQQPEFPTMEPPLTDASVHPPTAWTPTAWPPFNFYSRSEHTFDLSNIAAQLPYLTSHLPLPEIPAFKACMENITPTECQNGCNVIPKSRTASVASSADTNSEATSSKMPSSPPNNSNGRTASRSDRPDNGDYTSPVNGNSSSLSVGDAYDRVNSVSDIDDDGERPSSDTSSCSSAAASAHRPANSLADSSDDGYRKSPEASNSSHLAVASGVPGSSLGVNGGPPQEDSVVAGPSRNRGHVPEGSKDQATRERRKRKKSSKRSWDAFKRQELEMAVRAAFLREENIALKIQVQNIQQEIEQMRAVVYQAKKAS